jgi:Flp pilus assembly protein TadG
MKEKGQGLVETALILPFLLILIIGVVEGSIVLQRQLIVVNAAREGARFGAVGAEADDIHLATLIATSRMFEFTEENAVIAVIHATTNANGNGFEEWVESLYPSYASVPHVKQEMVLDSLLKEGDAVNLRLVIVDVWYNHQSVLGLPLVSAFIDRVPIGSWTVMRVVAPKVGRGPGCCALPITLPIWNVEKLKRGDELTDIRIGDGPGQFGWLYWKVHKDSPSEPEPGSVQALEVNLRNACNAKDFQNPCNGSRKLGLGSWVWGDPGESVADDVRDEVEGLVGTYYPVPVWDEFELCNTLMQAGRCGYCKTGTKVAHIVAFALMEITEVNLNRNPKTISAKFRGYYDGCE